MIYIALLLIISIIYAVITWRHLDHGLYLLAAGLPTYLLRFSIGPIPMTLLEVLVLIFIVLSLRAERGNLMGLLRRFTPRNDRFIAPICLLLMAATIGVLVAPDKLSALGIWKAYFVEPILVFIVATDLLRKRSDDINRVLTGLCAGGLFIAVFAIFQFFTGWGLPAPWDVENRVVSLFPYPNAVGLYLAPIIVISVLMSLTPRNDSRIFWIATALLSSIAIVLSQSEAAIVAVLATLFLGAVLTKRLRIAAITTVVAVTILVAISPFHQTIFDKLTLNDYSGQVRQSQWRETILMLKDHPVFGAGLNGYPAAMDEYHTDTQYEIFQYPHTLILNIWSELGLLGLIAFLWLTINIILSLRGGTTKQSPEGLPRFARNDNFWIAFLALTETTIHGLADVPYFKNDLAVMTWILIAIIASTAYAKPTQISTQCLDA